MNLAVNLNRFMWAVFLVCALIILGGVVDTVIYHIMDRPSIERTYRAENCRNVFINNNKLAYTCVRPEN